MKLLIYASIVAILANPFPATAGSCGCSILVQDGENVIQMGLESYVNGAVLAEMPAAFELEALKAQAIAARTYALRSIVSGGKHGSGIICTNASCCQGYVSEAEYWQETHDSRNLCRVLRAVASTKGEVLTYNGELIEAAYFSCSGGSTEDAVIVWGTEIPYLISVKSPEGESGDCLSDQKEYSKESLESILNISLPENAEDCLTAWEYTQSGSVSSVVIGNMVFSGIKLRRLLGLRSTLFTVEVQENTVIFHTEGYGHRVGMSQYGANFMAQAGASSQEILQHYYTGAKITSHNTN